MMDLIDDSVLIDLFNRLNDEGQRRMRIALCGRSVPDEPFAALVEDAPMEKKAAAAQIGLRALDESLDRRSGRD
jgi:hypothetical protein